MSWGRIVSSCTAGLVVFGVAALAVAMARGSTPDPGPTPSATTSSATQALADDSFVPYQPSTPTADPTSGIITSGTASSASATATPTGSTSQPVTPAASPSAVPSSIASTATSAEHTSTHPPAPPVVQRGSALPIGGTTSGASEVITVVAHSTASTTATLQAWTRAPGGGWLKHGPAISAHVGSQGLTTHPSESRSATPIGSFTLTQAFGAYDNPGTSLPYFVTTATDWWISQAGPLYNTHQRCSSNCGFTQGDPNEHLAYELPYYRYAVVIDANTRNAPSGVVQGAGSAFFLHVTDGNPTAGCVAIPQDNLVAIMQWLTLAEHPRILIGIA